MARALFFQNKIGSGRKLDLLQIFLGDNRGYLTIAIIYHHGVKKMTSKV